MDIGNSRILSDLFLVNTYKQLIIFIIILSVK